MMHLPSSIKRRTGSHSMEEHEALPVDTRPRPTAVPPILAIDNVSKVYLAKEGRKSPALTPVEMRVEQGEFVSLVGPSGCGKTTLLKICAGLVTPTTGAVRYRGTNAGVPPGDFGMVFQTSALLPWRTILGNVLLPADVLKHDRRRSLDRARELLELVGLSANADSMPNELSGGMQQRAALARALLGDPELLFMDEPFGALDALTRDEMNLELQRIHTAAGKTVLFVTHSIPEAILLSDRVVVMASRPGRIAEVYAVPLPRPRTPEDLRRPDAQELERDIRRHLMGTGDAA